MMKKRLNSQKFDSERKFHAKILSLLAWNLGKKGYYVRKNYPNNFKGNQNKFHAHNPDLFAFKNGKQIIIAIESCESIESSKSEVKLRKLGFKPGAELFMIIPYKCRFKASNRIKIWDLPAKILPVEKIHELNGFLV
jgi:hypothetical protein